MPHLSQLSIVKNNNGGTLIQDQGGLSQSPLNHKMLSAQVSSDNVKTEIGAKQRLQPKQSLDQKIRVKLNNIPIENNSENQY